MFPCTTTPATNLDVSESRVDNARQVHADRVRTWFHAKLSVQILAHDVERMRLEQFLRRDVAQLGSHHQTLLVVLAKTGLADGRLDELLLGRFLDACGEKH